MSERLTHNPPAEALEQPAQDEGGERTQERYDQEFAEIVARAEELGLSSEETEEALEDYAKERGIEAPDKGTEDESSGIAGLTPEDIINDPNSLMDRIDVAEPAAFDKLEASFNKLSEDVDDLAESMKGLGEAFGEFMEMLNDLVKLLQEIVTMMEERAKLKTEEERDQKTAEIQQRINDFGNKYGD